MKDWRTVKRTFLLYPTGYKWYKESESHSLNSGIKIYFWFCQFSETYKIKNLFDRFISMKRSRSASFLKCPMLYDAILIITSCFYRPWRSYSTSDWVYDWKLSCFYSSCPDLSKLCYIHYIIPKNVQNAVFIHTL